MEIIDWVTSRSTEEAKLIVDIARVSVLFLGLVIGIITVILAGRRYGLMHRQHVTESFNSALEKLSNPETSVRVGAIYALEQIAKDNRVYYLPVIDTLCAFLREYSQVARYYMARKDYPNTNHIEEIENLKKKISKYMISPELDVVPEDIFAAFQVIGRRKYSRREVTFKVFKKITIDYSPKRLEKGRRLNLKGVHLSFLPKSHDKLNFSYADFDDADFSYGNVENCLFDYARFSDSGFNTCTIDREKFNKAEIDDGDLFNAHIPEKTQKI